MHSRLSMYLYIVPHKAVVHMAEPGVQSAVHYRILGTEGATASPRAPQFPITCLCVCVLCVCVYVYTCMLGGGSRPVLGEDVDVVCMLLSTVHV